ncbi:MAG: TonB-dependent receptor [Terracidiphilus sp.]
MAMAQVDQGAINGVVKDPSGALIAGAQVTLTNTETNFVLRGITDERGEYSFSPIKIGNYTVSATAPGFETTNRENVRVNIQDRLNIDITLKPGGAKETVTVTGAPPMLQSESASVGQVMDTETINNTPLNGRNWVYIAQLTAGVDPGLTAGGARGGGTGDFSANGQRTTQNNFILDGVDNNVNVDDFQNGASYNVRPPPDALAEFKIDTSNYSAEFGHSAGAVVNASIKSGTNQLHGDLWEYVRNNKFDAADWDGAPNASGTGIEVPAYHENQFGATLGGPIWKNKLFYFGDAEANRITFSAPDPGLTVPTALERTGDFSELLLPAITGQSTPVGIFAPNSGGQVALTRPGAIPNPAQGNPSLCVSVAQYCAWNSATPGSGVGTATTNALTTGDPSAGGMMDAVAQEVMNDYPKPNAGGWTAANYNVPGAGNMYANYNVNVPIHDDTWQWDQRLDWNLSAKDQSYARYSYTHEQLGYAPPLGPILDGDEEPPSGAFHGSTNFNLAENFMASETHIFSPNLVNEFRFGYNWGLYEFVQMNSNIPAEQLIPGLGGVPFTGFAGPNGGLPEFYFGRSTGHIYYANAGSRHDIPSVERQNIYQILDNVTKIHGKQSFRFGAQLESIRTSFAQSQYPRGRYNFNGFYSEKSTTGNTGTPQTGFSGADFYNDNMGNIGLSPGWDTSYYRNYRAAYLQDDWKFNQKLTVNLGVRYDYIQPDSSKTGDLANFVIVSQNVTAVGAGIGGQSAIGVGHYILPAPVANSAPLSSAFISSMQANGTDIEYTNANPHSLVSVQHYNFAPRVGLSYALDAKTVVRAGYGLFYGAIEAPGGAELETNYPFAYTVVMDNQYRTQYGGCYPSTQTGAFNLNSQCPSNATPDVNSPSGVTPGTIPGASEPAGYTPYPYATTLETGGSQYFANGGIGAYGGSSGIAMSDTRIKTPYTQSFNLTVERQVSKDMVATIAYVGNNARHTYASTNPLSPLAVSSPSDPFSDQSTTAFPSLSLSASAQQWIGESMYNSLQGKLERRISDGLSFLASYTWSHSEDDAQNPGIGGGPSYRNTNLIPLKYEMTNSNYDTRHRITVNGFYDLPFGTGRKYMHQGGVLDYLVGGWSTSLTWVAQTGIPFTVSTGGGNFVPANGFNQYNAIRIGDPFKGGGTVPAANLDSTSCPAKVKNRTNWYNPCAFVDPAPGANIPVGTLLTNIQSALEYSGSKSNQIHGPGYERINMSGFKNFKTWREQYLQFRADAFNLFNTPTLGQPSDNSLDPTAGQITGTQQLQNYTPDARFFQLAAKYVF